MAGYIVEGSRTISNLIENVLRSARPLCPQPQEVNIVALVEEVKKHVEVDPYFSKEITLYHAPYQPTLHIIADKLMLRSCLLHLIRNAFQAIETKGSVHITVFTKADHALITVKDSGCGIAKEHIERLFSPFFTTKEKGTGLGLYETYRMIQCHGGSIEVKSSPECGTLFILSLPIKGYLS